MAVPLLLVLKTTLLFFLLNQQVITGTFRSVMEIIRLSHVMEHSRLLPPIATATMVQEPLCSQVKWQLGRNRKELVVVLLYA